MPKENSLEQYSDVPIGSDLPDSYWDNINFAVGDLPALETFLGNDEFQTFYADPPSPPLSLVSPIISICSAATSPALSAFSMSPDPEPKRSRQIKTEDLDDKDNESSSLGGESCVTLTESEIIKIEIRKEQNRQSAATHRRKKRERLESLMLENELLKEENTYLKKRINNPGFSRYRLFDPSFSPPESSKVLVDDEFKIQTPRC